MRFWILLLISFLSFKAIAQTDDDEDLLMVRTLALDTNVNFARRFSENMGTLASGYALAFIDNETRYVVKYVFKNQKDETLRVSYTYKSESINDSPGAPKRSVVLMQRISGELHVITAIYNYLFGANFTPESVIASATPGTRVKYYGKTCAFSLSQDEYEPGYWIMTFSR